MRCADDPAVLPDEVMARRAASLCTVAENASGNSPAGPVMYVIGTEVPVPGGATHSLNGLEVTRCEAAEQTLKVHREAFGDAGLDAAFERVIALVVQPGVEFDHDSVIDYDPQKAVHLQRFLQAHPTLAMEAHSTDYQLPHAYEALVRDGFAILKVGPALTFALRESLYALSAIEKESVPLERRACLVETMEKTMLAHPSDWRRYYRGTHEEQRRLRVYSYSDRLRYYWKFPEVEEAVKHLMKNLEERPIPGTLLSQHCPRQYELVRAGRLRNEPRELAIANVMAVLDVYSKACLGTTMSQR